MKRTSNYLLGVILMLVATASQADMKRANVCTYANANQRCVTVPLADAAQDAVAKQFQPPAAGESSIYIVRASAAVKRQASAISLDGQAVADLGPFTYVVARVPPGHHTISASADKTAEIDLNVEPGKLYFVETGLSLMFFTVGSKLKLLDEADGRSLVLKAARVADHQSQG
jgi:hypothetical protein